MCTVMLSWGHPNEQTDQPHACDDTQGKRGGVQLQSAGLLPSFLWDNTWERVWPLSFEIQFGVHVARGEPCMCVTTERGSLLRPLLARPAGQAPSRTRQGP
jgi:hypothetical protein